MIKEAIALAEAYIPDRPMGGPSLQDLTKRAEALQPLLFKNAPESDKNRRASEENIRAIVRQEKFQESRNHRDPVTFTPTKLIVNHDLMTTCTGSCDFVPIVVAAAVQDTYSSGRHCQLVGSVA